MKIEVESNSMATVLPDTGKVGSATSTAKASPASDQVAAEETLDFHQPTPQQWRPLGLMKRIGSILSPRRKNAKDAVAANLSLSENKFSSKLSFRKQAINNQTQVNNLEQVLAHSDLITETVSMREGGPSLMQVTKNLYSPFGSTRSSASEAQNMQEMVEIRRGGSAAVGPSGSSRRGSILYGAPDPHITSQSRRNSLSRVWQQVGGRMLFCGSGHINGMVEELLERRGMAPLEYCSRVEDSSGCTEAGGDGEAGSVAEAEEEEDESLDEDYWINLAESILKQQQTKGSSRSLIGGENSSGYGNEEEAQKKRDEWRWKKRRNTENGEEERQKQIESEEEEDEDEVERERARDCEIVRMPGNGAAMGGSFNSSSYRTRRWEMLPKKAENGDGSSTTRLNTTLDESPCLLQNHLQRSSGEAGSSSSISAAVRVRCRSHGETSEGVVGRWDVSCTEAEREKRKQQALEELLLEERKGERDAAEEREEEASERKKEEEDGMQGSERGEDAREEGSAEGGGWKSLAEGGGGRGGGGRVSLQVLLEEENEAAAEMVSSLEVEDEEEEEEEEVLVFTTPEAAAEGGGAAAEGGGGAAAAALVAAEGYGLTCCVCMMRRKGAALIPCGHTFCRACAKQLFVDRGSCALCNNLISQILDIF